MASLPLVDLTKDPKTLQRGTEEWNKMCQSLREGLEKYGCLLVAYDKLSIDEGEELFAAMSSVFNLPFETKTKDTNSEPFYMQHGYGGTEAPAQHERLKLRNPAVLENTKAFTDHFWPDGNPEFCETIHSISKKMLDLIYILMNMVYDSYEVERYHDWHVDTTDADTHLLRYPACKANQTPPGLNQHADPTLLTLLYQNESGLITEDRNGEWMEVTPPKGSFIILAGQALRAWSNDKVFAPSHKVICKGDKDRLNFSTFLNPKIEQIIETPGELFGEDQAPLFKAFPYGEFAEFYNQNKASQNSLDLYAGV